MAHYAFFLRVSTSKQQLESQYDEMLKYAKADGVEEEDIVTIQYKESGKNLKEEERLGIKEFKEVCEREPIVCTYISELSRIARTEKVLYSFIDYLQDRKIQLKCKNPEFTLFKDDFSSMDANARILVGMFGALAAQEIVEKKIRFARGKERRAKEGKYNGGAIPFGYKKDAEHDNLIVTDEDVEAPIVREIFNMYEQGKSQIAITRELYERGVKGRAVRSTKNITLSLVHQILTNELLTGKKHLNKGSSYERQYPQIITEEQFQRCRKIAETNNTVISKSRHIFFAQGIMKCVTCGRNFVSTGFKGYYHCKDAYNYDKKYEGYEGEPMCPNKICIATNIIDSLLWELTKDYESTFIMNEASEKLSESKRQKQLLQDKLDAIPKLLAINEERVDDLLDALAEGMKKEKYNVKRQKLKDEERQIRSSEATLKEQIAHYDILIEELNKSISMSFDMQTDEGIDSFIDYSDAVWKRVSAITDDAERSRLVHKHIKKVTVEATSINYKFKKYPNGKDVSAKLITIYPYLHGSRQFVFVPFNGKGGVMLQKYSNSGEVIQVPGLERPVIVPEYSEFPMEYLPRFYDKTKARRREVLRAKREALESVAIANLRKEGYISMNEMREISKLAYGTIYHAIKEGNLIGKSVFKTWYAKKEDFDTYLERYAPKPRPYRQTNKVFKLSPEEKFLNAVFGEGWDKATTGSNTEKK